jgi:4-hydroxybenzoate polyprenyltransferase
VIASSAAATLLYTPLLKGITVVKNATVAAIIAASPVAGALAARTVSRAFLGCLFVFFLSGCWPRCVLL